MGIHLLVRFRKRIEERSRCSWREFRVAWPSPLFQHLRDLSGSNHTRIESTDHNVVGSLIGYWGLVVGQDSVIQIVQFASQLSHRPSREVTQIPLSIPGVFPRDLHLATEREIVAAESLRKDSVLRQASRASQSLLAISRCINRSLFALDRFSQERVMQRGLGH